MSKLPKLNILVSHFYIRDSLIPVIRKLAPYVNILVDSGAFSDTNEAIKAAKTGKKYERITVQEYIKFCTNEYMQWSWGYINLDHPLSSKKSLANYRTMLKGGTRPLPVAHSMVTKKMYKEYVDTSDGLICVGGIAGKSTGKNRKILAYALYVRLFNWGDKKVRLHALGFGKYPEIIDLPLYSVDSTTWMNGNMYGEATIFTPRRLIRMTNLRPGHIEKLNRIEFARLLEFSKQCGVDFEDWKKADLHRGSMNIRGYLTAFAYLKLHEYLALNHDKKYFFVLGAKHNIDSFFALLSAYQGEHFDYWKCTEMYRHYSKMDLSVSVEQFIEVIKEFAETHETI